MFRRGGNQEETVMFQRAGNQQDKALNIAESRQAKDKALHSILHRQGNQQVTLSNIKKLEIPTNYNNSYWTIEAIVLTTDTPQKQLHSIEEEKTGSVKNISPRRKKIYVENNLFPSLYGARPGSGS